MSTKKGISIVSTAKRKGKSAASASARSMKKAQPMAGAPRSTVVLFSTLENRIKEAESYTELALYMKMVREGAALVGIFDFLTDARFYSEQMEGSFKTARKLALGRFRQAYKARARVAEGSAILKADKAYRAALRDFNFGSLKSKDAKLVQLKLAHFFEKRQTLKTPFQTEVAADNPFNADEPPIRQKRKLQKAVPSAKMKSRSKRI